MKPDDKICYCYNVSLRKLVNFARQRRIRRASQLSECLGAGTGCGWCIPILKRIYENSQLPDGPGGDGPEIDMTPDEYAARRDDYIRNQEPRNRFD